MQQEDKIQGKIDNKESEIQALKDKLQEKNFSKHIYAKKLDELHIEEGIIERLENINKRIDKLEYLALNHRKESPEYLSFLQNLSQFRDEIAAQKDSKSDDLHRWRDYVVTIENRLKDSLETSAKEKAQMTSYVKYMKRLLESSGDQKALKELTKISRSQKSSFEQILSILDRFPWYLTMVFVPIMLGFMTGMAVNYVSNHYLRTQEEKPIVVQVDDSKVIKAIEQNNIVLQKQLNSISNFSGLSSLTPIEEGVIEIRFDKKETISYEEQKLIKRIKSLVSNQNYICVIEGYASQEKIYSRTDFNSNYELATARALNTKYLILKNLKQDTYLQFLLNTKVDLKSKGEDARRVVVKLYQR